MYRAAVYESEKLPRKFGKIIRDAGSILRVLYCSIFKYFEVDRKI